ncbi:MAG TPA: GNAT family N-acetyltransferase [Rhodopila sp.]|jgi:ribosomal protein S18 acetylase RimI-like enzyme|nr:GNAT family N-acetyltransferase [Rhodopila sp.]
MSDTIRLATTADCDRVKAIVTAAYAAYIPRIGRKPGPMDDDYAALIRQQAVRVLEDGPHIKAVLVLIPEPDSLLLDNIVVDPAFQHQGIGRRLLAFAEQTACEAGLPSIRLYTHQAMTENIALYTRVGYVETHRGTTNGLHRVYMVKRLDR